MIFFQLIKFLLVVSLLHLVCVHAGSKIICSLFASSGATWPYRLFINIIYVLGNLILVKIITHHPLGPVS